MNKKNPLAPTGQLWHNHKLKYSYLAIPKSGSNTLRKMSGCMNGPTLKRHPNYIIFSALREPIERYISGFIEIMVPASDYPKCRYHYNLGLNKNMKNYLDNIRKNKDIINVFTTFTDYIIEKGFFEVHTEPQHYYLIKGITLYHLDNLEILMKDLKLNKIAYENKTESSDKKEEITNFLCNNDEYKEKIMSLFDKDIKLYNSFKDRIKI